MMMSVLDKGRVGIASLAVGIAQAGLEAAIEYSKQRKQFDRAISEFQGVQWLIADMAKDIEAARLLTEAAAERLMLAKMLRWHVPWQSALLGIWS